MDSFSPVFLSFRKEDTGRTFVSHLYRSLDQKQIQIYKDENQQTTREGGISPEVAKAIRESNIAIVVISENYAASVWCLEVLAEISWFLEIRTVFYEVDPEDLTRPDGKFAQDLRRHEEIETPETVNRWRNALEWLESRTDRRFCSRNWEDDSKMLDDLIISVTLTYSPPFATDEELERCKAVHSAVDLDSNYPELASDMYMKHIPKSLYGPEEAGLELERYAHPDTSLTDDMSNEPPASDESSGLVGMYRHKKEVYGLLDLESNDIVRTVGIWGIQGVGKTTLAECVFDDISRHFQHHCFLTNVNNIHQNRISPSLLKHLPGTRRSNVDIFDAIKSSLVNRKVLLVIDGVDDTHNEQFKSAVKVSRWLGPGSRVIMTSRSDYPLDSCGVKYEMECLKYEEALQLFSLYAFKKTCPLIGFESFSIRAVHFAGRLPLALKVLGSFLYDKDEESWKRTLRKLEASLDHGSCLVSNYIGTGEYLPRRQVELEQYVGAYEEEYSPSYHMLL